MAQKNKAKMKVYYKEISRGVHQPQYKCPPHVWYFANVIFHWMCEFCPAMRHSEPKSGLRTKDVEHIHPDGKKVVSL